PGVPNLDGPIMAPRGQVSAVAAERDGPHGIRMAQRRPNEFLAGHHVPDSDRAIHTRRSEQSEVRIRTKHHRSNHPAVTNKGIHLPAGRRVQDCDGKIRANLAGPYGEVSAIRAERHRRPSNLRDRCNRRPPKDLPSARIPNSQLTSTSRSEELAIRAECHAEIQTPIIRQGLALRIPNAGKLALDVPELH